MFLDLLLKRESKNTSGVVLAVVPMALLETWETECATWCPHFRVFRYHSSSQKERFAMAESGLAMRPHEDVAKALCQQASGGQPWSSQQQAFWGTRRTGAVSSSTSSLTTSSATRRGEWMEASFAELR